MSGLEIYTPETNGGEGKERIGGHNDHQLETPDTATVVMSESIVEEVEPWEHPVELADLVEEMEERLTRHLVLPDHGALGISLWVAAAYIYDNFRIFPRLVLHSPTKRCGKTTCLEVIDSMAPRALMSSGISPAAVYRVIQQYRPTLLIDESDSFLRNNDELRGIVNSSHTKAGAWVIRCHGDNSEPKQYSTWAPIVLAGIKTLQDTIMDRSIVLSLQRKLPSDRVEELPDYLKVELYPLRQKLTKWAEDNGNGMRNRKPRLPECSNDRAKNNWKPLFAIAEEMGGDWPDRCAQAFAALEAEESEDLPTELLRDIRSVLEDDGGDCLEPSIVRDGYALTSQILESLNDLDERPWKTMTKNGLTAHKLRWLLSGFEAKPEEHRFGDQVLRGYPMEKLKSVFARYLGTG